MDLELESRDSGRRRRKFNVTETRRQKSSKSEKRNKKKSHGTIRNIVFVSHFFIITIEKSLKDTGLLFSRKGLVALFISLLFFGALCLGFIRNVDYESPPDLYKSTKTQSRRDFDEASKIFPTLDSWKVQIDVRSRSGGNVLSFDCLNDASQVHNLLTNNSFYKQHCLMSNDGKCTTKSPSTLQGFGNIDFEILTGLNLSHSRVRGSEEIVPFHESLVFYNIAYTQNVSMGGFIFSYFIQKPKSNQERLDLKEWIQRMASRVKEKSQSLKFADISVLDTILKEDKVWAILHLKSLPLLYSIPIFLAVCIVFSAIHCRCWLSILVFFLLLPCTLIGFICAFAACNIFGIVFQELYIIVPCFLFPKVFMDSLLLLKALEKASHLPSSGRRAASSLVNGGLIVTTTTFINILLFGIPIWSSFKGISHLFVLALLSVLFTYLTTLALCFNIVLWITRNKPSIFFSARYVPDRENESCLQLKVFVKSWVQLLLTIPAKVILILVILGMIASSICAIVIYNPRFKTMDSFYKESDAIKLNSSIASLEEITVVFKGLNYSSKTTRSNLIQFSNGLKSISKDNVRITPNWVKSFQKWKQVNGKSCSFYLCLNEFLNNSIRCFYKSDLNFQSNNLNNPMYIETSRFRIPVTFTTDIIKSKSTLESFQRESNKLFNEEARIVSKYVLAIEDFTTFLFETLYVFIMMAIALVVLAFPLTASMRTPFVLLLTFVMLSLEVLAVMFLLGAAFNQLSFTCVFLVLVLAFNYSLYVSEAFITSKYNTVLDRVVHAVYLTATPIVLSCLLLVLVSIVVGFSFPHLSLISMQVFPVTLGLGVFHAIVLLPFILISYGNSLRKSLGHSSVPMNSLIVRGYRKRRHTLRNVLSMAKVSSTVPPKFPSIAIIGMGCRFPQASDKDEFWYMLTEGRCTVSSFPNNRPYEFNQFTERFHPKRFVTGRMCTMGGSYMDNIRGFDAAFFKISSQEANAMDPQQRILLQVAYEAIEDSGMKLEDLQACNTGVFVGIMNLDYGEMITQDNNIINIDQFAATGTSATIISNRISFCFNFKGPSLTVDTACSSSLTALNIAVKHLRNGDCNVALVCGSNLVISYKKHLITSIAGLLAPDGKCKSFDSSGDGYGRGEGVGAIVLKLSEVATKDEDDIYCEVIACGMNNDGASAMPMTAPSISGQAEVAKVVLNKSGLQPHDVDYVEAHGTGTAIGDVVETSSIAEVYGVTGRMLRIGSVKSNLNHTESTAGLAGLMKVALMIKHGQFVPTINVHHLNEKLKLTQKGLVVQELLEPWERNNGKPRIGAVNSFGFGGSNCHVIVREVTRSFDSIDELRRPDNYCNGTNVITLSTRSSDALKDSARFLAKWLLSDKCRTSGIRDICFSLNERHTLHPHRLAAAFTSVDEAAKSLEAFYTDQQGWEKSVSVGESTERGHRLLFMFGGQGAQWFGMGRELVLKEAVVTDTISEIDKILRELGQKWNLKEELVAPEEASKVNEMVIGQVATFSVQFAIARLLISWGVHPSSVVGHSLGEYAASCIAGALSLKETLRLVLLRAELQAQCPKNGAMAALGMSAEKAQNILVELKLDATVSIAAYNDAHSVTLSGDKQSIECLGDYLTLNSVKVFWRVLNTPRAFHSNHMAPIENLFKTSAQKKKLKPKETHIPFYSTVKGNAIPGRELDVSYWWQNIRKPVKFHQAIKCALNDGYRNIIEISVQPTLSHYVKQIASQEELTGDDKPILFPTLPRKTVKEQHKAFVQNTICSLNVIGYPVQWHLVRGPSPCTFVRLPTYPWQQKDYWYRQYVPEETVPSLQSCTKDNHEQRHPTHPFLGKALTPEQFSGTSCWAIEIDLHKLSYLKDHALSQGSVIMPGAAYIEMAFAMAKDRFSGGVVELHNVKLSNVLTLPESQVRLLRLRISTKEYPVAKFNVTTIQNDQTELELSSGYILCEAVSGVEKSATTSEFNDIGLDLAPKIRDIQQRMKEFPMEEFHAVTKKYGFTYGPYFSVIKKAWKGENEGLCLISIDSDCFQHKEIDTELAKYVIHPSVIDACLQSCFIPISTMPSENTIVPVGFDRIQLTSACLQRNTICHIVQDPNTSCFDITLMTLTGNTILKMKNFRVAELNGSRPKATISEDDIAYELTWKETSFESLQPMQYDEMVAVVLMDCSRVSTDFTEMLDQRGVEVFQINFPKTKDCGLEEGKEIGRVIQLAAQRCLSSGKKLRIVSFWPIEADLVPEEFGSIDRAQNIVFKSSLYIMKLISECVVDASAIQVTYVTQGICSVKKQRFPLKSQLPWSSTVWGLRRTGAVEYPNTVIRTVDLSPVTTDHDIKVLADQLGLLHNEEELAIRENSIFASRVVHSSDAFSTEEPIIIDSSQTTMDSLYLEQNPETSEIFLREDTYSKLLQDEVEVELRYLFSNEDDISVFANNRAHQVGFSGRVVESMSSTFQDGEEVFGVIKPCRLGKRMKINDRHLLEKPQKMNLSQAAVIPSCFVMALEIVQKALPQQKSLRLLVHEGDTSLGFAVITVSTMHGHHVCCTANEEETTKKLLFESGVEKVTDLSCLEFDDDYDEFFDAVIFISSPRPGTIQTSLRLLKARGILFVACGTFNGNFLLPGNKHIRYERVHPDDLVSSPATFCGLWNQYCPVVMSSSLKRKIDAASHVTSDLFEHMKYWNEARDKLMKTSASGIFKTYAFGRTENLKVLPTGIDRFGLKSNRTYIVAGGVRGYGFEVARWMCSHGAHTVLLLARSPPSQDKLKEVENLQTETGANVVILQIDVSREDDMLSLEQHLQNLPSVAGIIHTAMVLRDNLIKDMDIDSYREVMAPKVKGGFLLHKLSLKMDLDFFIMFSSIASMVFNVSQASYSAANAFLDALASYRRNVMGIPGLSINWGPIGGAGVLTRQSNVAKLLSKSGLGLIPASEGPKYMSKISICQPSRSQVGLYIVDWPVFLGPISNSGRLEQLRTVTEGEGTNFVQSLASRIILETNATKRLAMINEFVVSMVAYWADMDSTSEVDVNTSLYNYGIDSTAALSLKMTLESSLQISLEVFYFMQPDTTPAKMTQDIANWFQTSRSKELTQGGSETQKPFAQMAEQNGGKSGDPSKDAHINQQPSVQVFPLYNPKNAEIKFFCVHPAYRFAMNLTSIANGFQMQNIVSFYAIGFKEPTYKKEDWGSVRELALQYVDLIRKEQKHGPYILGGYSYGGIVAYEMASILEERKERVEFLCMIDTFPWSPVESHSGYNRLASWFRSDFSYLDQIKMQYDTFIEKVAKESLKMTEEQFEQMKSQHQSTEEMITFLEERSRTMNIPVHGLSTLWKTRLHDSTVAARTHVSWEPPAMQYSGHVTYLRCQDQTLSPKAPLFGSVEECWKEVFKGTMDVLVLPGDHFSLSEMPFARVTGGIVATAVGVKYRSLYPELNHVNMSYLQKMAVNQLKDGVLAILYPKKARKSPNIGKIFLNDDNQTVTFCKGDNSTKTSKFTGKVIKLQELHCIMPGRYVRKAIKVVSAKRSANSTAKNQGGNLSNVVSLFGKRRIFNVEFLDFDDQKVFYLVVEGLLNVKMEFF